MRSLYIKLTILSVDYTSYIQVIFWDLSLAGYYLYMESSQTTSGQRAELVSPWMASRQGGQCFKFYYNMYGSTIGSLAVKLDISNGKSWYIFYKSGNQGYGWKKGTGAIDLEQGLQYKVTIKTGSLYKAIAGIWLVKRPWYMRHYTMPEK